MLLASKLSRWLLLWAALMQASGCMTVVAGGIPPSTFQFHSIIPYVGPSEGGWKVAKVLVLLGRLSSLMPSGSYCDVEIGVPEVNHQGPVSDSFAQVQAALAADETARLVLREKLPTALLCRRFIAELDRSLKATIPGAKVTKFSMVGVPHTTFPP